MSTRPPAADPQYHPVVRSVARGLRKRCGVPERSAILLAVSGGADSVALLRSLALLAPRRRWRHRLVVAHVHHGLRGADADHDQRFVQDLAEGLGLDSVARRLEGRADRPGNVEATAREARYAALHDQAIEHACGFVATGHHADDQLETMLLRMIRGATPGSLSAMRWSRPLLAGGGVRLIRPMLA
ncbi:MAG: tRNA lysidine(34) synthetase TilS, partial [Planctomycetota bacterium]